MHQPKDQLLWGAPGTSTHSRYGPRYRSPPGSAEVLESVRQLREGSGVLLLALSVVLVLLVGIAFGIPVTEIVRPVPAPATGGVKMDQTGQFEKGGHLWPVTAYLTA